MEDRQRITVCLNGVSKKEKQWDITNIQNDEWIQENISEIEEERNSHIERAY